MWQNSSGSFNADWPKIPDESGNFVTAVNELAKGLRTSPAAISNVQIIGPESANADGHGLALVKACESDQECWSALGSIASHSYGMAADDKWANATESKGYSNYSKGYWVTEVGALRTLNNATPFPGNDGKWQGVGLASRFLNDLNHMVDTWVWFIGAWAFNEQIIGAGSRQEDMKLVSTCPPGFGACYPNNASFALMPQYHYAKQLRQAFDFGCEIRYATANTTKTINGHTRPFLPDMVWSYGDKSPLNVAVVSGLST
jgi:hypothetical protein